MTTYYAAVKWPLNANADEIRTAIRNGLEGLALTAVEEYGVSLDTVREWLDLAANSAEYAVEWGSTGGEDE